MRISIEKLGREILENIENYKTNECLDVNIIGYYCENRLSEGERERVENHLKVCLFCLNQLNELAGLLYFKKHGTPLPEPLFKKLSSLIPHRERNLRDIVSNFMENITAAIGSRLKYLTFRRYAIGSIAALLLIVYVFFYFWPGKQREDKHLAQVLEQLRYASVQVLDDQGRRLGKDYGFNIDPAGRIITDLDIFGGGIPSRVRMADGTTLPVRSVWVDANKNLAVIDVEGHNLPFVRLADYHDTQRQTRKAVVIADPYNPERGISYVIATLTAISIRNRQIEERLELTYISERITRGIILDSEGRMLGIAIGGDGDLSFGIPVNQVRRLIEEKPPVPIKEVVLPAHSEEAVDHYIKGILARNAENTGAAVEHFKRAIEINPDYEDAYLELAGLYYDKFIATNNQKFLDLEIAQYKELIRIDPRNPDYHFYLALSYENKGWYRQALKEYEKVVSLDPKDEEARCELGIAYLIHGEIEKAKQQYEALKAIDSPYAYKLKKLIELTNVKSKSKNMD